MHCLVSCGPGASLAEWRRYSRTDLRGVLPTVLVPSLILHRVDDRFQPIEGARYLASLIPGAHLVELPGVDEMPWTGDTERVVVEIHHFLERLRDEEEELDRVLATVLFTDIVASTDHAAQRGDRAWKALRERHHAIVRALLARFRGTELDTAGDGFFASFPGPARAIRCAEAITSAVSGIGLEVRAGVHTGECERVGDTLAGLGVHVGARIAALAAPGEILVSQTVTDLVTGSGLQFVDRGDHTLKGVPKPLRLYAVAGSAPPTRHDERTA
jgi:class 3 adenylate cyclase